MYVHELVCLSVFECVWECLCARTGVCVWVFVFTYVHVCMYKSVCVCVCVCVRACVRAWSHRIQLSLYRDNFDSSRFSSDGTDTGKRALLAKRDADSREATKVLWASTDESTVSK